MDIWGFRLAISDFGLYFRNLESLAQTIHVAMHYLSGFSLQAMLQCNA